MNRYWLIQGRLLTSQELKQAGASPLRAVSLGRCFSVEEAMEKARRKKAKSEAVAIAHNVRLACDSGRGAKWGLTKEQIDRLRAGEILALEDALGGFRIGYSKLKDE